MKKTLMLALLLVIAGSLFAQSNTDAPAKPTTPTKVENADEPSPQGGVESPALWWMNGHKSLVARAKRGGIDVYFLGDSITNGWGKKEGLALWDKHLVPLKAANFGVSGDRTQHVLYRIRNGELDAVNPKVVVLMIGTNNARWNSPDQTASGIKAIIDTIREKAPRAKILLLAIFPRGATADDPLRKKNDAVNKLIASFDDGKTIRFLNINDRFLDAEGNLSREIMPDLLHPGAKGYGLWADALREPLTQLLAESADPKAP